jgi:hypothetical protein
MRKLVQNRSLHSLSPIEKPQICRVQFPLTVSAEKSGAFGANPHFSVHMYENRHVFCTVYRKQAMSASSTCRWNLKRPVIENGLIKVVLDHVDRVLSFFSSRQNWESSSPSPEGECAPSLWIRGEGHTRWRERGWESPNSFEGT